MSHRRLRSGPWGERALLRFFGLSFPIRFFFFNFALSNNWDPVEDHPICYSVDVKEKVEETLRNARRPIRTQACT